MLSAKEGRWMLACLWAAALGTWAQAQGVDGVAGNAPYAGHFYQPDDRSLWYAQSEAIFFTRDGVRPMGMSADIDFTGTPTLLMSTDDLNFDYEPGARLTLGRQIGSGALEISYFGLKDFEAFADVTSAEATSGGTLHSPFASFEMFMTIPPFDGADLHEISYRSNLQNVEVNLRRQLGAHPTLTASWLLGFRYMKIREEFTFYSFTNDLWEAGPGEGTYGVLTHNDLIGMQLGGDILWRMLPRFGIGATAKGAILGNGTTARQYVETQMPPPAAGYSSAWSASETGLASIVQTGLFGQYQLTEGLRLRGGYEVMMVSGLALAPEQLVFTNDPLAGSTVDHRGYSVYHGPSGGVELVW